MKSKKTSWCLVTIGFVLLTGMAFPQSKKDFEKAAEETIGCRLIPYSQLYDSCRGAYSRQRDWCTGEREKGCADLPEDQKDEARKRRDNADECLKMRKEVRKVYSDTIDQLKGEKADDIRPLAEEIIKRIEATFPNHDKEIENTERRRNKCAELQSRLQAINQVVGYC